LHSPKYEDLESLKKIGGRWGVMRCLYEALCDMRLDLPRSIQEDFEVARSTIETGCRHIRDAELLLDWVESKLTEKAISLNNLDYWEGLLNKAKVGELTKKEFRETPFMKNLLEKYEFLSYCKPDLGIERNEREMMMTDRKPIHEIKSTLRLYEKLVIVGCGICATETQTGGEEQVKDMIKKLGEKMVLGWVVIESPCDMGVVRRDIRKVRGKITKADAILALCCDTGVQTISEITGKRVVPALNTHGSRESVRK